MSGAGMKTYIPGARIKADKEDEVVFIDENDRPRPEDLDSVDYKFVDVSESLSVNTTAHAAYVFTLNVDSTVNQNSHLIILEWSAYKDITLWAAKAGEAPREKLKHHASKSSSKAKLERQESKAAGDAAPKDAKDKDKEGKDKDSKDKDKSKEAKLERGSSTTEVRSPPRDGWRRLNRDARYGVAARAEITVRNLTTSTKVATSFTSILDIACAVQLGFCEASVNLSVKGLAQVVKLGNLPINASLTPEMATQVLNWMGEVAKQADQNRDKWQPKALGTTIDSTQAESDDFETAVRIAEVTIYTLKAVRDGSSLESVLNAKLRMTKRGILGKETLLKDDPDLANVAKSVYLRQNPAARDAGGEKEKPTDLAVAQTKALLLGLH